MITIAIIDKYPITRAGLEALIRNSLGEITIIEFNNFNHFNEFNANNNTDFLIVGNTGESVNNQCDLIMGFKLKNVLSKVIIYDEFPDFSKVSTYFKFGINAFLTKQLDDGELLKCFSEVESGRNYINNEILEVLLPKLMLYPSRNTVKMLTHREFEIANLLVDGETVSTIAKKLQLKISTISTFKRSLFNKLKINNVIDLEYSLRKLVDGHII